MRLIDADALIQVLCVNMETGQQFDRATHCVDEMPTVDAVPVRHGHWIEHKDYPGIAYLCSECGCFTTMPTYHYCPHCGAKMDGAERKEE